MWTTTSPSEPVRRWRRLVIAVAGLAATALPAQSIDRVHPLDPVDGAIVGARPVFRLAYDVSGEDDPREMRFRITLAPADPDGDPHEFDQKRRGRGWMFGDEGTVLYRPRKPLSDGLYRFEAWAWNGVEWIGGDRSHEIRIDTVPPADVDGVRVRVDPERNEVTIDWDPVSLDREGRPEYVARYHVYRYERRGIFRGFRTAEIGVVVGPRFVDREPPEAKATYYKVTAEDEAGNKADR